LDHLLDWLDGFGARRVVLALGHLADAVIARLQAHPRADLEPEPLGTAGAIRFARQKLVSDPVLVLNGDRLVDADLCAMLEQHRQAGAAGTILCTEVADASRCGRIILDAGGRIERFVEKDPDFRGPALVNAGVYLLSPALIDRIAAGQATSLERDVFVRLPPGSLMAFAGRFPFIDIGTPASLAAARDYLARR
jgi:mannose-1-phosphate guanylyltransferase